MEDTPGRPDETGPAGQTDRTVLPDRLARASAAFEAFRPAVAAGDPWALSPAYGSEPESDWGPKEVLAHTAEMVGFWQAEIDRILAGGPDPVPFGRVATDPVGIERIGRDRELTTSELFDRIAAGEDRLAAKLGSMSAADTERVGLHPRNGEMTVSAIVERFLVAHLEDHVNQLRTILATRS